MFETIIEVVRKFNPYHDRLGRFASADSASSFTIRTRAGYQQRQADRAIEREKQKASGGGSGNGEWAAKMDKEQADVLAMKPNKQAHYVYKQGGATQETAVAAMKNGQAGDLVKNYFDIMKQNGDPTPTKPTSKQLNDKIRDDVESGKYKDYGEAKTGYIKQMSGQSDEEAAATKKEFDQWFGGSWSKADTATLDKYIEQDHAYDGKIYRGMKFNADDFYSFMNNISPGAEIGMKRNASWSSNEDVARSFSNHISSDVNSVVLTCVKNKTSAPVAHLSSVGEEEVLSHSKAKWTVLHSEIVENPNGSKNAYITVVEKGE